MPRKALVTARAALRFAHRAADERGRVHRHRRGLHEHAKWERAVGALAHRPTYQRLPKTSAQRWTVRHHLESSTTCVEARPLRATTSRLSERIVSSPFIAWSRYAPFPRGASRSRCGIEGATVVRYPSRCDGDEARAGPDPGGGHSVNRVTRPGLPRRVVPKDAMGSATNGAASKGARTLSAEGRRGEVRFFLQRVAGGLYVEREEIPRRGLRTQQSVQFADAEHFKRWCDNDPIRFEHPLLHVNLKRDADELWRGADATEP